MEKGGCYDWKDIKKAMKYLKKQEKITKEELDAMPQDVTNTTNVCPRCRHINPNESWDASTRTYECGCVHV